MGLAGRHQLLLSGLQPSQLEKLRTSISDSCQQGLPLFEELVRKSRRLESQLGEAAIGLGSYLDTLEHLAELATNSAGEAAEVGSRLKRTLAGQRLLQEGLQELGRSCRLDLPVGELRTRCKELGRKERKGLLGCLKARSRLDDEEGQEARARLAVRVLADQERSHYLALEERILPLVTAQANLARAADEEEEIFRPQQLPCTGQESSTKRNSFTSLASFSYWGSKENSDSDSGILTPGSERRKQTGQDLTKPGQPIYSTVRRSPSPRLHGSLRSLRVPPPSPPEVGEGAGARPPPRPTTLRCSSLDRRAPWGSSLTQSSLFSVPKKAGGEEAESGAAVTVGVGAIVGADSGARAGTRTDPSALGERRREKRARNMTQAISLSSLPQHTLMSETGAEEASAAPYTPPPPSPSWLEPPGTEEDHTDQELPPPPCFLLETIEAPFCSRTPSSPLSWPKYDRGSYAIFEP